MIKRTKIRSNGITLISEQNQSAGSVTAALFFKSGILYEKERKYGVTRFVQELLFRSRLAAFPDGSVGERIGRDHAAFFCETSAESAVEAVRTLAAVTDAGPFSVELIEAVRGDLLRECAAFTPSQEDETERMYFDLPAYDAPPAYEAPATAYQQGAYAQKPSAYTASVAQQPAAPARKSRVGLFLRVSGKGAEDCRKAIKMCSIFEGGLPLILYYTDEARYDFACGVRTDNNPDLVKGLKRLLGEKNVVVKL